MRAQVMLLYALLLAVVLAYAITALTALTSYEGRDTPLGFNLKGLQKLALLDEALVNATSIACALDNASLIEYYANVYVSEAIESLGLENLTVTIAHNVSSTMAVNSSTLLFLKALLAPASIGEEVVVEVNTTKVKPSYVSYELLVIEVLGWKDVAGYRSRVHFVNASAYLGDGNALMCLVEEEGYLIRVYVPLPPGYTGGVKVVLADWKGLHIWFIVEV